MVQKARIGIVTDSTALLPAEVAAQHHIRVAPLHLVWNGTIYRDGIDIQPDEFFRRLRKASTLPTTSGAIQGEFVQIFEGMKACTAGIAVFVLSQDLSAAYNSALLVREVAPDLKIEVVDTRTSTAGMGFGVLAAARVAEEGGSLESVICAGKAVFARTHVLVALDTLEYLRRGGRISWPAAVMADWLKVKPVLSLQNGKVEPIARPLTKAKARRTIIDHMARSVKSSPVHVAVMHGDALDEARMIEEEVRRRFNCVELIIRPFTPIMGAHTGPGLVGLAFYSE